MSEKGKVPMADGPSVADTEGREDRRRRKKKKDGKNGKSVILPVGLHRTVSYYSLGEKCILLAFSWPHSSLITNQKQPGGPPEITPFSLPRPFLRLLDSHPKARAR